MTKRLAHYFRVIEAAVLIAIARALIATLPFRMWSRLLGRTVTEPRPESVPKRLAYACADAVERAAMRQTRAVCLPRAMALHWMLGRRKCASTLSIGALPIRMRGSFDTLHAWTAHGGVILAGGDGGHHVPIAHFQLAN